ncbi:MAG: hypothetical protein ACT4P2_08575 [Pseudomonadota bacterium]
MLQTVTIQSLPQAFEVIKAMQLNGYEWGEDYRRAGGKAVAEVIEGQMAMAADGHLAARGAAGATGGWDQSH